MTPAPDNTAVRVALWRALRLLADAPPHVLEDRIGLALVAPEEGWQGRPDMSPLTRPFRASIVARARFVEDLVEAEVARGVGQYVILGAGLDFFAQRRPALASRLGVFELAEPAVRPGIEAAARGARASGTPWLSFFTPDEMLALARGAGFARVEHVSADALTARNFAGRADGLRLPSNSEALLVATTEPAGGHRSLTGAPP